MERLTNIVVERHGVTHVASERELADLCPQVKALHLANNCLSHWQDVSWGTHTFILNYTTHPLDHLWPCSDVVPASVDETTCVI